MEKEIFEEIQRVNPCRTDTEIYIYALCEWGLGRIEDKPDPADYGLDNLKEIE